MDGTQTQSVRDSVGKIRDLGLTHSADLGRCSRPPYGSDKNLPMLALPVMDHHHRLQRMSISVVVDFVFVWLWYESLKGLIAHLGSLMSRRVGR